MPSTPPPASPIPAPPRRFAARGFAWYVRGLARRHFAAVHLGPRPGPPAGAEDSAVLFVANHTNWWDGFLAALVSARLGRDFRILMEAVNLDRYRVFNHVGALPMRRDSRTGAYADLAAAARHLERGRTALWIFPQGQRRPAAAPIRDTERGAAQLALLAGRAVTIQPVAFRYAYLGEQQPEAFVWLGESWQVATSPDPHVATAPLGNRRAATVRAARRTLAAEIERALRLSVAALDQRLATESLGEFEVLVPGRLSINKRVDRARHALGLLPGPFHPRNG